MNPVVNLHANISSTYIIVIVPPQCSMVVHDLRDIFNLPNKRFVCLFCTLTEIWLKRFIIMTSFLNRD